MYCHYISVISKYLRLLGMKNEIAGYVFLRSIISSFKTLPKMQGESEKNHENLVRTVRNLKLLLT
jgi:hypothetical protein